jgi:hypothetical protein
MNRDVARAVEKIRSLSASPAHCVVRPKPEVATLSVHGRPVLHLARGRTRPHFQKNRNEELLVCSLKCIRGVL